MIRLRGVEKSFPHGPTRTYVLRRIDVGDRNLACQCLRVDVSAGLDFLLRNSCGLEEIRRTDDVAGRPSGERREALSTLREAFGHSIANGPVAGQTQVEAGAATLAWFLTQDLDPVAHPRDFYPRPRP